MSTTPAPAPVPVTNAAITVAVERFPMLSRVRDTADGFESTVCGVGTSRGVLSVWMEGRPAVPYTRVVRAAR